MYTVGRAAELTGIPSETLRKWESRYGIVVPLRTDAGYRLYDDAALRLLSAMRELVDAGWSPRAAARHVLGQPVARVDGVVNGPAGDLDRLVSAAESMDGRALDRTLRAGLPGTDLASEVDQWLLPSLERLGRAWEGAVVTVAGEHFVSAGVQRRLARLFDAAVPPDDAPRVVVGLARGSRHELGVLAFATVLRHEGVRVTYVGGDLPLESWLSSTQSVTPDAVVLAVPVAEDVPAVREVADALARAVPELLVAVGGAHQARITGTAGLGHRAGEAARSLAERLVA